MEKQMYAVVVYVEGSLSVEAGIAEVCGLFQSRAEAIVNQSSALKKR